MKARLYTCGKILYFSQWCKKGYAIFAALGKQVQIGELAVHICECALLKSAQKGVITHLAACWEERITESLVVRKRRMIENFVFCRGEVYLLHNKIKYGRKGYAYTCPFYF